MVQWGSHTPRLQAGRVLPSSISPRGVRDMGHMCPCCLGLEAMGNLSPGNGWWDPGDGGTSLALRSSPSTRRENSVCSVSNTVVGRL